MSKLTDYPFEVRPSLRKKAVAISSRSRTSLSASLTERAWTKPYSAWKANKPQRKLYEKGRR